MTLRHAFLPLLLLITALSAPAYARGELGELFHLDLARTPADPSSAIQNATEGSFPELVDHFGGSESAATFQQRYYINTSFADNAESPVIFLICGEYSCDKDTILSGVQEGAVDEYVRDLHANLVILENRYYGDSRPFSDLSTDHLKYLTTAQVIEDMAAFHRYVESRYHLTGKWISIGGSYAGVLSAYFRLKHPELDAGALSSSGPVRVKLDFWEYDRHMTAALSPQCAATARKTVAYFEGALQNAALMQALRKSYQMPAPATDLEVLDTIEGTVAQDVQYGSKNAFCQDILGGDPVAGWLAASQAAGAVGAGSVTDLSNITDFDSGARQWTYQTCVEYGYFQTADQNPDESLMPRRDTLQYLMAPCQQYFGITTPPAVNAMNQEYFQRFFGGAASNILFTNAQDDPWSELGLTPANSAGLLPPSLVTDEYDVLAHHGDLKSTTADTPASVLAAKNLFLQLATKWVGQ